MLILADHHQKLIYTRAHLLPPSSPSGNDDQKSNPTFFSNMQKVHKKHMVLYLTKLSLPKQTLVMTFAISQGCWFYARLGITFVTSQIKGWCFDISAWLTKWNPQSQFRSTMREKDDSSSLSLSKVSSVDDVKTEKRAKGLRLITRQANLLIVIAPTLDTWSWRAGQQNKISHKALLLLPNHKQVSPYPFFPK